ncbi:hypothetical protein L1887_31435 [Cichorium endivia]|nr:hypothetical protein L1887_31435 [Cichorium endivia]
MAPLRRFQSFMTLSKSEPGSKIRTRKQNREAISTTIQEQQAISESGTKIGKKIGSLPYLCNQMERRREVRREAAERRCAGEAVAATRCELD